MNTLKRAHRWLVLAAGFSLAAAQAAVALRGASELTQLLKTQPPCCVIDARNAAHQRQHPLAEAVPYRPGLRIIPTASVIVVADRDQDARRVGASLARQHPGKPIFAVKGGVTAWEAVLKSLAGVSASSAPGAAPGISFVIPHNTCETGTPLQILQSKPRLKP